jgi:RNA methyltransferase, TrmH family
MQMITSLDNERIKAARKLQSKRRRHRSGKLLVEGVRLIRDAMQSGFRPQQVFYSPESTATNREAARLLKTLQGDLVECVAVSPQVLASLAETVTPQGIVAVLEMRTVPIPAHQALVLILDGITDPGNAGTLLRSAEAAGADMVIFGPHAVDAYNDKVVRAGMGAHFRLPLRICATWEEVWTTIGPGIKLYVAEARAELKYDAVNWREPAALIVGSEARGPSEAALMAATAISIPMCSPVESLNVAMAGTIVLFEAARQLRSC